MSWFSKWHYDLPFFRKKDNKFQIKMGWGANLSWEDVDEKEYVIKLAETIYRQEEKAKDDLKKYKMAKEFLNKRKK